MRAWVGGLLILGLLLSAGPALAGRYDRLLHALAHDEAYKVRMKALRVITKKVRAQNAPAPDSVMAGITRAATEDSSHLVRGMACVALGQLEDARGQPALTAALNDPEPFVRAQAESALALLTPKVEPGPEPVLVLGVDLVPGLELPAQLQDDLLAFMQEVLQDRAPGRRVVQGGEAPGYQLRGAVSQLVQTPIDGQRSTVSVEVKVSVSTWPQQNLRNVVSAKASAKVPTSQAGLRVQRKVLRAAVQRAIEDALEEIGGT